MKFRTAIQPAAEKGAMGIVVPPEAVEALGSGKRPKVVVSLKGYSYRSTVSVMGGRFLLPLAKEHRAAGSIVDNEEVEVTLELDTAPREVETPDDLAEALAAAGVRAAFDKLAFTHRKEHVRAILEAKTPETRARRVAKAVEMVKAKA